LHAGIGEGTPQSFTPRDEPTTAAQQAEYRLPYHPIALGAWPRSGRRDGDNARVPRVLGLADNDIRRAATSAGPAAGRHQAI